MGKRAKYDNTQDIPWKGDAREYLMNFCWTAREVNNRRVKQSWRGDAAETYQKEADKWSACLKWLEGF